MTRYTRRDALAAAGVLLSVARCRAQADAAPLGVAARTDAARPIHPHFLGANGNMTALDRPWQQDALIDAFAGLDIALFRYPAGTLANTWDWDRGWLDAAVADQDLIDWVRAGGLKHATRRYPLEDLARLTARTGTVSMLVLNMLSRDLEHAIRGLARARSLGVPVRFVELGNELYFNLPLESRVFPTPEDYGRTAARWTARLRAEFPGVQVAIPAGGRAGHPRSDDWTRRVLSTAGQVDALAVHVYTGSTLQAPAPRGETATALAARQQAALDRLRTAEGRARFFAAPAQALDRAFGETGATATGLPVWLTEWNLRGDDEAVRGTWSQTLFTLVFVRELLARPVIAHAHLHNLVGAQFGALHLDAHGYDHLQGRTAATLPLARSAAGLGLSLAARTLRGQTSVTPLVLDAPDRPISGEARGPGAFGWLTTGPTGARAIVVNLDERPLTIRLQDDRPARPARVTSGKLDQYVNGEHGLRLDERSGDAVQLPGFGVAVWSARGDAAAG